MKRYWLPAFCLMALSMLIAHCAAGDEDFIQKLIESDESRKRPCSDWTPGAC